MTKLELWIAGAPWKRTYGIGFWSGDLLCIKPIPQKNLSHREWENLREQFLSPVEENLIIAILKWLLKLLK